MTKKETTQYNGILLLTGYLQRLFVSETIYSRLGEQHDKARLEQVKALLDTCYTIIPAFEETKQLTDDQRDQLLSITTETEELMKTYFKPIINSFNQKLAIVASALYAEQHVNSGIIRLGEVFGVGVNKDFHQRVKFYEQRTKMVDYLVYLIEQKEEVEEQYKQHVESWFNDVMKNKQFILEDFKQIGTMI